MSRTYWIKSQILLTYSAGGFWHTVVVLRKVSLCLARKRSSHPLDNARHATSGLVSEILPRSSRACRMILRREMAFLVSSSAKYHAYKASSNSFDLTFLPPPARRKCFFADTWRLLAVSSIFSEVLTQLLTIFRVTANLAAVALRLLPGVPYAWTQANDSWASPFFSTPKLTKQRLWKSTTLENARKPIATVFYRYVYTIVLHYMLVPCFFSRPPEFSCMAALPREARESPKQNEYTHAYYA